MKKLFVVLAIGAGLIVACRAALKQGPAGQSVKSLMQARGLTEADVNAAFREAMERLRVEFHGFGKSVVVRIAISAL
jgi:hypothetical protein